MCTYLAVRVRAGATSPLRRKHHVLRKLLASSLALTLAGSAMALAGCGGSAYAGQTTANEHQAAFIGDQSGGRVFLFLQTDDFARDYQRLLDKGVRIEREPLEADYGTVAVFLDLYGNKWDLIEFRKSE